MASNLCSTAASIPMRRLILQCLRATIRDRNLAPLRALNYEWRIRRLNADGYVVRYYEVSVDEWMWRYGKKAVAHPGTSLPPRSKHGFRVLPVEATIFRRRQNDAE